MPGVICVIGTNGEMYSGQDKSPDYQPGRSGQHMNQNKQVLAVNMVCM